MNEKSIADKASCQVADSNTYDELNSVKSTVNSARWSFIRWFSFMLILQTILIVVLIKFF